MAGKGSRFRPVNYDRYKDNYEAIFGKRQERPSLMTIQIRLTVDEKDAATARELIDQKIEPILEETGLGLLRVSIEKTLPSEVIDFNEITQNTIAN